MNSWTTVQWSFFPQLLGSSSSSKGVNYTLNSWNDLLWSLFTQILSSSSSLAKWNNPELMNYCCMIPFSSIACYFSSLAAFNQPEHIRNYPTILVFLISGQFEQVYPFALHRTHGKIFYDPHSFNYSIVLADQLGLIPPNSLNILLLSFKQFGCVELLELMKCSSMILVPSITQ